MSKGGHRAHFIELKGFIIEEIGIGEVKRGVRVAKKERREHFHVEDLPRGSAQTLTHTLMRWGK